MRPNAIYAKMQPGIFGGTPGRFAWALPCALSRVAFTLAGFFLVTRKPGSSFALTLISSTRKALLRVHLLRASLYRRNT